MKALPFYGTILNNGRVVVDNNDVSAAGVTSGIDSSLILVALPRGDQVAKELQLYVAYELQPRFDSGSPTESIRRCLEQCRCASARNH